MILSNSKIATDANKTPTPPRNKTPRWGYFVISVSVKLCGGGEMLSFLFREMNSLNTNEAKSHEALGFLFFCFSAFGRFFKGKPTDFCATELVKKHDCRAGIIDFDAGNK